MSTVNARDLSWMNEAACRNEPPDIFFPERGETLAPARAICANCPSFDPCYERGLREKFGVWAGTSERERRRIRRQLGIRLVDDDPLDDQHDKDGLEAS